MPVTRRASAEAKGPIKAVTAAKGTATKTASKVGEKKRARQDDEVKPVATTTKKKKKKQASAASAARKAKPAEKKEEPTDKGQPSKQAGKVVGGADAEEDEIALDAGDESDGQAEDDEDDAILAGFSDVSDGGADSSDEDEDDDRKARQISASGVVKLPSSRDDAVVRSRLEKAKKERKISGKPSNPIVLYFGRVPKSMPEEAMKAYLTQFGNVRRLRLSRNRKTGAPKHYAFVEFEDEEVGKIVQETMHNYLLEGRLLQVHVVPKEKQHPNLWVGANRAYRATPADRMFRIKHDKPRTGAEKKRAESRLLHRQEQRRKRIQDQGIKYDFDGYVSTSLWNAART